MEKELAPRKISVGLRPHSLRFLQPPPRTKVAANPIQLLSPRQLPEGGHCPYPGIEQAVMVC